MAAVSGSVLRRGGAVVARGVREQPRWFALAVFGSTVYGIMTGLMAWAIGWATREVLTPAAAARAVTPGQLWTMAAVITGIVTVNVLGIILRRTAAGFAMYALGAAYRRRVTRQYLDLPLRWHHKHPSGQLLSNANADVEATWNIFAPLPMALGVVVMLLFGAVQMVIVDPVLAAVGMVVFPLLFAANAVFQRRMSPRVTYAQRLRAEVSEVAHESFEAALVVKTMGREDLEARRFAEVTNRLRDANIAVGRTRGTFDPAIESIPTIGTLAVIGVGAWRASQGQVSAAEVVQIAYLFSVLAFPVRAFGWVLAELPRSVVGWERVDAVLQASGAMHYGDRDLPTRTSAAIHGEHLDYAYEIDLPDGGTAAAPAIRDVTLTVTAGSTVALVGPTGSGKSTLTGLLLRLVDPDSGAVLLDGLDLRSVRKGGIADVAALVPQQTFMFEDTVRDNVTLGARHTDEQVWEALRIAQAERFVLHLPRGLDTMVGERGANLSGGQRQRVALARAVIRRPQLLVLDDATSAVDPSVEQRILGALRGAAGGATVLVVAYRMATIALADEIAYLEGGRLVEHGTHEHLLERCPGYAALVSAYAREAADRAAVAVDEEATAGDSDEPV
ncbi:MAG: ABC transporter ATP-binding protein [Actinomycetales bacterium]|nr:ABC transporter ATP-binding protein [Actinomycetales bacterium]